MKAPIDDDINSKKHNNYGDAAEKATHIYSLEAGVYRHAIKHKRGG